MFHFTTGRKDWPDAVHSLMMTTRRGYYYYAYRHLRTAVCPKESPAGGKRGLIKTFQTINQNDDDTFFFSYITGGIEMSLRSQRISSFLHPPVSQDDRAVSPVRNPSIIHDDNSRVYRRLETIIIIISEGPQVPCLLLAVIKQTNHGR